jgi:hypothetical protein
MPLDCTEWGRRTDPSWRQRLLLSKPARAGTKMYRYGTVPFRTVTTLIYRSLTLIHSFLTKEL